MDSGNSQASVNPPSSRSPLASSQEAQSQFQEVAQSMEPFVPNQDPALKGTSGTLTNTENVFIHEVTEQLILGSTTGNGQTVILRNGQFTFKGHLMH